MVVKVRVGRIGQEDVVWAEKAILESGGGETTSRSAGPAAE